VNYCRGVRVQLSYRTERSLSDTILNALTVKRQIIRVLKSSHRNTHGASIHASVILSIIHQKSPTFTNSVTSGDLYNVKMIMMMINRTT